MLQYSSESSVNYLEQKHGVIKKASRFQVMLLKMSMTRCCETSRLTMRRLIIQSNCLYFHYKIYYLVMLISEGMTRARNAWAQALHTQFTRIRHVCC